MDTPKTPAPKPDPAPAAKPTISLVRPLKPVNPSPRGPQQWNTGNNPAAPRLKGAAFKGNQRDKSHFGRKPQGGK